MTISKWKKRFILTFGFIENLIFSGTVLGWSALNQMLKSEGVYEDLCFSNNTKNFANPKIIPSTHKFVDCNAQDKMLNIAFNIETFFMGFTAFIWGLLIDKWGLRIVRLLTNFLITLGAIILCFTNQDRSYLIFPAIVLLCLGSIPVRLVDMQFANLYPDKRSTIISLYSGAFCASSVVLVVLKYIHDSGVSFGMVILILVLESLLMPPFTLFILPPDQIKEDSELNLTKYRSVHEKKSTLYSGVDGKYTISVTPTLNKDERYVNDKIKHNINSVKLTRDTHLHQDDRPIFYVGEPRLKPDISSPNLKIERPLKISLLSWAFNLHQLWFAWSMAYTIIYVGAIHLWISRVTRESYLADNLIKIYGLIQIACLGISPIGGFILDNNLKKIDEKADPITKKLQLIRTGFWPILIASLFSILCIVCRYFNNLIAIYLSMVFITIFRSFLAAVGTSYIRMRLPGEHFNRLLGIMMTLVSVFLLIQYPLFAWEVESRIDALGVNIVESLLTFLAFMNPLHLLITPLQRRLLKKEVEEERVETNSDNSSLSDTMLCTRITWYLKSKVFNQL